MEGNEAGEVENMGANCDTAYFVRKQGPTPNPRISHLASRRSSDLVSRDVKRFLDPFPCICITLTFTFKMRCYAMCHVPMCPCADVPVPCLRHYLSVRVTQKETFDKLLQLLRPQIANERGEGEIDDRATAKLGIVYQLSLIKSLAIFN